jgi:hypothetical protein
VNEKSKQLDQNPITEKGDLEIICAELILGRVDHIHQFVGNERFFIAFVINFLYLLTLVII